MFPFAGLRPILLVVCALAVIGIGYTMIQRIQNTGRQELQVEQLTEGLNVRSRIDEAVRNAPSGREPSLGVLRDFLDSRD